MRRYSGIKQSTKTGDKMDLQAGNLSQSLGPSNQLFMALIQTILTAQSSISPPEMWPSNSAPMDNGW